MLEFPFGGELRIDELRIGQIEKTSPVPPMTKLNLLCVNYLNLRILAPHYSMLRRLNRTCRQRTSFVGAAVSATDSVTVRTSPTCVFGHRKPRSNFRRVTKEKSSKRRAPCS